MEPATVAYQPDVGPEHSIPSKRARVEEVEDEEAEAPSPSHTEDAGGFPREPWVEDYPLPAGSTYGNAETPFESLHQNKAAANESPWAPFDSPDEWELARWLLTSGLSQRAIDEYLNLNIVRLSLSRPEITDLPTQQTRNRLHLSFKNKYAFFKKVDALPRGAKWQCELFEATGDELDESGNPRKEVLELWKRDPVECIRKLLGNPGFKDSLHYAPERLYMDAEGRNRLYGNMWTGDWWWDLQVRSLCASEPVYHQADILCCVETLTCWGYTSTRDLGI